MVFHSRFVMLNLIGRTVGWRSQARGDDETGWREALRHHALDMVVASAWGVTLFWLNPHYFWWVTPIIGALVLAVPVSVVTSRVTAGDRARRLGLFLIPEESRPPPELRDVEELLRAAGEKAMRIAPEERDGFVRAAVDPYVNALRRGLLGRRRSLRPRIRAMRAMVVERALAGGPAAVRASERRLLLRDPELVDALHAAVWSLPERERAARWGRPGTPPAP
jgi:membrane glycosyltransferase